MKQISNTYVYIERNKTIKTQILTINIEKIA